MRNNDITAKQTTEKEGRRHNRVDGSAIFR